jgi:UDP-N-acetylmuramate dehydrogenase
MRERLNVAASDLTTFKIGGVAEKVFEPEDIASLKSLLKTLDDYYILGNGSNVVFSDKGITKPIVHLSGEFTNWNFVSNFPDELEQPIIDYKPETQDVCLVCFAACPLMRLSSQLSNLSYTGLEFAAGIPGTIGGAVAMNAGAHGNEISEIVQVVYTINREGLITKIDRQDIEFEYRSSNLKDIIIAAGLKLRLANKELVTEKRKSCLEYRKSTQPLTMPSAGSVFVNIKNDQGETIHAAQLLDSLGLKGEKVGGVQFSTLHANWLVKISENASY